MIRTWSFMRAPSLYRISEACDLMVLSASWVLLVLKKLKNTRAMARSGVTLTLVMVISVFGSKFIPRAEIWPQGPVVLLLQIFADVLIPCY